MRNTIFLFLVLACPVVAVCQKNEIKGSVIAADTIPLEYFHVVLLDPADSSFIKGGAFTNGEFEIKEIEQVRVLYSISYMGYKNYTNFVDFTDSSKINAGTIIMQPNTIELESVTVSVKKPVYSMEKGKSVFYVDNSTLSDVGDATDLLKYTPKLIVNADGQVQIPGKSNVAIYIDNHAVQNAEELNILKSHEIEKVEVITNPSAKYDASGQAVVNIVTRKLHQQGLYININANSTIARRFSYETGTDIAYKTPKTYLWASYNHTNGNNKNYRGFYRENENNDTIVEINYDGTELLSNTKHSYKAGIKYQVTTRQGISLEYTGWHTDKQNDTKSLNTYTINGSDKIIAFNTIDNNLTSYNRFRLNHSINLDTTGQKLETSIDYINHSTDGISFYEMTQETSEKRDKANSNLSLYIFRIDYSLPQFIWNLNLESGLKYYQTKDKSNNSFEENNNDNWEVVPDYSETYSLNEQYFSVYASLEKKIGRLGFNAGIRWENYKSDAFFSDTPSTNINTNNIFPSLSLNYKFSEKIYGNLAYSRHIIRP